MPDKRLGRMVAMFALVIGIGATSSAALSSPGAATTPSHDGVRSAQPQERAVTGGSSASSETTSHPPQKQWWSSYKAERSGSARFTVIVPDQGSVEIPEKPMAVQARSQVRSTRTRPRLASRGARPRAHLRPLRVRATAYAIHGRTSQGTRTNHGTIAVDPRVIPYGTRIYVPGYGWGRALDCGGAVQGNVIDLWMPTTSQCYRWGNRHVEILVEARPRRTLLASRGGASRAALKKRRAPRALPRPATTSSSR